MRNIIKNILKESQDFQSSVFLIMSEDEKFVKYNLHVAGEKYFSGGRNHDGWENIEYLNNKTFQEFYVNQRKNAEGMLSIIPQTQLDAYKPKVVEYIMGFFRSEENVNDLFDKLNESNIEHDESVFYNGGHPIWDKNFREGVSYMFVVDNDSSGPVYWVKDDINSWRPFSVDFFNRFFSKFDYDETDKLFESEENDFSWVDELPDEPMHHILMGKYPREPMLIDEVHTIMFNPPAKINGEKFRKVAYWLEDLNYYPEDMIMEGYTSYVKITRNKHGYENGRYVVGPELNQQELYNLSQSTKKYSHGDWNGNFWYEEFANRFF